MKKISEIFLKIKFYLLRPGAVFVFGENKEVVSEIISKVLRNHFKLWKKIFVFAVDFESQEKFEFFANHSFLSVLVLTDFKKENMKDVKKVVKIFSSREKIILNNDAEGAAEFKEEIDFRGLTFGFKASADFQASDIKTNGETNFKLNYEGSSVPVWIRDTSGRNPIYGALSAFSVGTVFGLNLIEISQSLKIKNH